MSKGKISASVRKEIEAIGIDRAQQMRDLLNLGRAPIADLFDFIEQQGILLLRYPTEEKRLHAFYAQLEGQDIIYIDSNEPLGRQIFSGAHELYHFFYDKDELRAVICDPGNPTNREREVIADAFASEFLMPMEGIHRVFLNLFKRPARITEQHIVRMQHVFKVSYAAMAYAMYKAGILENGAIYGKLKKMGGIDQTETLISLTKRLGLPTDLIFPSPATYPRMFFDALISNYEDGYISYGKMESLLAMWNLDPASFGYERNEYE